MRALPSLLRALLRWSALGLGVALASCKSHAPPPAGAAADPSGRAPPVSAPHAPVFRDGGLELALQAARSSHQLVVLELWARWCPPCMAMRASTFTDPALFPIADTFAWVAVDRDSEEGDALARRLHVSGIPALFVLDPAIEAPRARWNYPVSGPELAALLRAVSATPPVDGLAEIFQSSLVAGNPDAVTESDRARARDLLDRSPPSWPFAPFVANLLLADAQGREALEDCEAVATRYEKRLPAGSLRTSLAFGGQRCALKQKPPRTDVAHALLDDGEALVDDPATPILAWDRAWRYAELRRTRLDLGDAAGTARAGEHWLSFVRKAQAEASPEGRAVLAASLQFALEVLGDPAGAIGALAAAVQSAPDDAEALVRYASALDDAGRVDEALAAAVNGAPSIAAARRLPVLWEEAMLVRKKNDAAREGAVLDAAVALFAVTPRSPHFDAVRTKVEARRTEIAGQR